MPAIELKDLSKQYAPGQSLSVNNVDLEIHNGELLCLLGPSGCGKTTTLRMLAGLESVTSGTITVGDHVWDDPAQGVAMSPNKRRAPMVFQSYALWPHLTVRDNVAFGLKTVKMAPAEREREVNRVLTQMSIVDYADRYPADLSGGQQQRVALARALAMRPELLLMDEPLSNLDATLRVKMRAEIIDLHRETATTIVMVTHDQWEAMTLASRIALMNNGEIIQVATPRDIYKDPVNRFVAEFIGNPPINIIELEIRDAAATAVDQFISRQWGTPFAEEASSVGIRPEDITISPVRNDDSLIVGKIVATAPTGGAWITDIEVESTRLHMTHLKEASVAIDDEVYLAVDPKSLMLFNEEGNRVRTPNNL